MVLGQLIARPVPKVQTPRDPDIRHQRQRPVERHEPNVRASVPDLLEALVLLRSERPQYLDPLRRRLEAPSTYPSYNRL